MGLILDSSVLISAERQGQNARQMLASISTRVGNTEIAISVVTLIELAHGAARADTSQRKATRQQFIQELLVGLPVHPVTVSVALRAGQIDGENQANGVRLPLSDLIDRGDRLGTGLWRCHGQSSSLQASAGSGCGLLLVAAATPGRPQRDSGLRRQSANH
jgi:predicted nucleic acid-binding protein